MSLHRYNINFAASDNKGRGAENRHLDPLSIAEIHEILSYWKRGGFEISNIHIFKVLGHGKSEEVQFNGSLQ